MQAGRTGRHRQRWKDGTAGQLASDSSSLGNTITPSQLQDLASAQPLYSESAGSDAGRFLRRRYYQPGRPEFFAAFDRRQPHAQQRVFDRRRFRGQRFHRRAASFAAGRFHPGIQCAGRLLFGRVRPNRRRHGHADHQLGHQSCSTARLTATFATRTWTPITISITCWENRARKIATICSAAKLGGPAVDPEDLRWPEQNLLLRELRRSDPGFAV